VDKRRGRKVTRLYKLEPDAIGFDRLWRTQILVQFLKIHDLGVMFSRQGRRCGCEAHAREERILWAVIDHPRDQVWFTLMLRAGLRVGEVVRLKRADILAPATTRRPARLRVEGKGRKERVVCLTADAYAVLDRWLPEGPGAADTPLCPNHRGQPMTVNGLQERLRHYCQKAGVAVTCHQLRRHPRTGRGNILGWFLVQPEVAKTTRVCSYDRAGQGWSDPGPEPRDGEHIAQDLHALLQNASIPGPYVLAGHSYGGLFVRAYAAYYPGEVVGLVLLDSAQPDQ